MCLEHKHIDVHKYTQEKWENKAQTQVHNQVHTHIAVQYSVAK